MNKYKIILADPPSLYKCWSYKGEGRSASGHYDVMSMDEIKSIPVSNIAEKNAVLFLWTTWPLIFEAKDIIKTWGFTYKSKAFTWVKTNKKSNTLFWGMGYYTRSNDEPCLLATRGKGLPRKSKAVHSVIIAPFKAHSRKPGIVRDRIVELFGDLPRIELFARERTPGWHSLGFDLDGMDIRKSLYMINVCNQINR